MNDAGAGKEKGTKGLPTFLWAVPRNNIPVLKPFNEWSEPLISSSHGGGDCQSVCRAILGLDCLERQSSPFSGAGRGCDETSALLMQYVYLFCKFNSVFRYVLR